MIKIKANDNALHSVVDIAVRLQGTLYHGVKAVIKKDGVLYTIWEKAKSLLGGLFVQRKQVKVSGRIIKFKGQ